MHNPASISFPKDKIASTISSPLDIISDSGNRKGYCFLLGYAPRTLKRKRVCTVHNNYRVGGKSAYQCLFKGKVESVRF